MKVTCELAAPGIDGFTVFAQVGGSKLNVGKVILTGESRASYELSPGPDAAWYLSLQNQLSELDRLLIRQALDEAVDAVIARRDATAAES